MAFLQSKPEGLEPQMWSKPNKQGELKKQGEEKNKETTNPFFLIINNRFRQTDPLSFPDRPLCKELEDQVVHLAAR